MRGAPGEAVIFVSASDAHRVELVRFVHVRLGLRASRPIGVGALTEEAVLVELAHLDSKLVAKNVCLALS